MRFKALLVATLLIASALGFVVCIKHAPIGFRSWGVFLNMSNSMSRGWYRIEKRPFVQRGDTLLVCLPRTIGEFAVRRSYVRRGTCPGKTGRIGKPVRAIAGDTVVVDARGVTVNQALPIMAPIQLRDRRGRRMHMALGRHVLQPNECFLLSTHSVHSYDSRYFGPVRCTPPYYVLRAALPIEEK